MENTSQSAGAEKDNRPAFPKDRNDRSAMTNGADGNYPNQMNDRNGAGSPYGGTQSADSKMPDGNQIPANPEAEGKTQKHADLGEEYKDRSSYGEEQGGGKEGEDAGTDAAGTPIR